MRLHLVGAVGDRNKRARGIIKADYVRILDYLHKDMHRIKEIIIS